MTVDGGDPYRLLGVPTTASHADIVHAYRQRAQATHPDANPGDETANERFRVLADAYAVLGDPDRRAAYDRRTSRRVARTPEPGSGPPLWAGPVHVEPSPAHPSPTWRRSAGGRTDLDVLEVLAGWLRRWSPR